MKATMDVVPSMRPRNMSRKRLGPSPATSNPAWRSRRFSSHTAGSSTWRRTHSVKKAGRIPTKNTARHPYRGSTNPTTMAADAKPMAHELCI